MNHATQTRLTADDLLALPDGKSYELVGGELVERPIGNQAVYVAGNIFFLLASFIRPRKLGLLFPAEAGYRCFRESTDHVRKPDISFIRAGRLPGNQPSPGYDTIPPDLVVEVLSPRDIATELDQKVEEYLRAGVRLVWVVNPDTRTVRIHRPDGSITGLHETDELSGEDVLPGFTCSVAALFEIPSP
jgi:Uma2 family endonuclease